MTARLRAFALLAALLAAACGEVLAPGSEWVVGTWRLMNTMWDDGGPEGDLADPTEFILVLDADGSATVREYGRVTLRTDFRTEHEGSLRIDFDDAVRGGTNYSVQSSSVNMMSLGFADGAHVFLRE